MKMLCKSSTSDVILLCADIMNGADLVLTDFVLQVMLSRSELVLYGAKLLA